MKAGIILVAAAVLSFGQMTAKKATTPPPAKKTAPQVPMPDTWQRSKECATQAAKVMAEANRRDIATTGEGTLHWENHYSPKYNRCFIKATYVLAHAKEGGGKDRPMFTTQLIDAFERVLLAESAGVGPTSGFCSIDGKTADCDKAASFISERMKN